MKIEYPNEVFVNAMDLSLICCKVEKDEYSSCEEFMADIKLILHNIKIFCFGELRLNISPL